MISKKGQVALEGIFVVLFIVLAITQVIVHITEYSGDIEAMSTIRAKIQGYALERSLDGITTHLVRIDAPDVSDSGKYEVYIYSEDCTDVLNDIKSLTGLSTLSGDCSKDLFDY